MHVLVTGAAGFLGSHLVRHLALQGHDVTAQVRRQPLASIHSSNGTVRSVSTDLAADTKSLPQTLDAVVHTAAVVGVSGVPAATYMRDNAIATYNLVAHALAAGARRFVYISTTSVHGTVTGPVLDDLTPIVDPSTYGVTKLIGERIVADAASRMAGIALRLPAVIGPGAHSNFPAKLLQQIKTGSTLTVFNPTSQYNNAAHVDDLGPFIVGLLEKGWDGFDAVPLAADGAITIREVADLMLHAHGSRLPIIERPAERTPFVVSNLAAHERHSYKPMAIEVMLERFVKDTISETENSPP